MSYKSIVVSTLMAMGVLFTADHVSAQGVQWRYDYVAARKEATETGRALLLDFGTTDCFWCRKLDATTFRDPKIVQVLNAQFIPVKIDANQYQQMTTTLGVDSFPTLILATPNGQVVGRHVGYATVAQMGALLDKAPLAPPVVTPRGGPTPIRTQPSRNEVTRVKPQTIPKQLDADLAALYPKIAASLNR